MNSDSTVELVSLALDAALMRQTAIANNIANANTVNYQTLEVNFEQQVQDLPLNISHEGLNVVHPHYQVSDHQSTIDEQMALNVQNMTHYRALNEPPRGKPRGIRGGVTASFPTPYLDFLHNARPPSSLRVHLLSKRNIHQTKTPLPTALSLVMETA